MSDSKIVRHTLYGGSVVIDFNPDSPSYRYTVTDALHGRKAESVRGVTTVISDILDKPGLRNYPMDQALSYLLGQKWNEASKSYICDEHVALLKPDTPYGKEFYAEALTAARGASTARTKRGGDVGTMAHKLLENWTKKLSSPLESVIEEFAPNEADTITLQKIWKTMAKWLVALESQGAEVMAGERVVYSRNLNYAGTLDIIIHFKGKLYLLDFKTTNRSPYAPLGIYPEMFLQLGAYAYAWREESGAQFPVDDVGIVNIGKDGVLNTITGSEIGLSVDDCERAFAFACRLHDFAATAKKTLTEVGKQPLKSILNPLI